MQNILIIPSDNPENVQYVINLANEIKQGFPQSFISTLVKLENYDEYYNSGCIGGLIIEPENLFAKASLFHVKQFNVVLMCKKNIVWLLACFKAKVKTKIDITKQSANNDTKSVLKLLNAAL